ncbi:hypothetical protein [Rhizobium sp. R635]|nr:hypothetical protein [Rhizobium sp. R635]
MTLEVLGQGEGLSTIVDYGLFSINLRFARLLQHDKSVSRAN